MTKKISKSLSATKGSALYIAGLLTSVGISMLTEDKIWEGFVALLISAVIYISREFLLKK